MVTQQGGKDMPASTWFAHRFLTPRSGGRTSRNIAAATLQKHENLRLGELVSGELVNVGDVVLMAYVNGSSVTWKVAKIHSCYWPSDDVEILEDFADQEPSLDGKIPASVFLPAPVSDS